MFRKIRMTIGAVILAAATILSSGCVNVKQDPIESDIGYDYSYPSDSSYATSGTPAVSTGSSSSAYMTVNGEQLTDCQAVFSDSEGFDVMGLTGYYGDTVCVVYVTYSQSDSRNGYTLTKGNADEYHVYSFGFSDISGSDAQNFNSIYTPQYFNNFTYELQDYGRQDHAKFTFSFEVETDTQLITFYGEGEAPWVYVEPSTDTTPDTGYVNPQSGTRRCMACSGSSGVCRVCDGKGKTVGDVHGNLRTCQSCGGSGLCIACNGTGRY